MAAPGQYLSKRQLQLPIHGLICWLVGWTWLLQVSTCTIQVDLMTALIRFQ